MNAIVRTLKKDEEIGGSATARATETGALAETSCASVPLKPTAAMLADGARAGGVSVEVAWRIYLAMIRTAQ